MALISAVGRSRRQCEYVVHRYHRHHFQCMKAIALSRSNVSRPGSIAKPQCCFVGPTRPIKPSSLSMIPVRCCHPKKAYRTSKAGHLLSVTCAACEQTSERLITQTAGPFRRISKRSPRRIPFERMTPRSTPSASNTRVIPKPGCRSRMGVPGRSSLTSWSIAARKTVTT